MSLLPEGYKRLLYIESTGTQWIDTGFVPTATAKVVAEVQYANSTTTERSGLFIGSSHMMFGISNSKWEIYIGNKGLATSTAATTKRTVVVLDAVSKTGVVSGAVTAAAYTAFGAQSVTMPIFVLREGANSFRNYSSMKLFSYKIYNANALVRNFIPCINDAGEVGLYETVNGVFCGNSGTGVFIAGPEFWYDELEYIESTGTQWIDTGVSVPHASEKTIVEFAPTDVGYDNVIAGHNAPEWSWATNVAMVLNSNILVGNTTVPSVSLNVFCKFEYTKTYAKINDGASVALQNLSYTDGYNNTLFYASTKYGKQRVKHYQLYDGDTLVRDFVPAKLPDGSIGLIDKLTDDFYPNMGTGVFTAGKIKPTKYMELEYIESTGTQYVDTGFIPNQDSRVDITAMRLDSAASSFVPYGAAESYQKNAFECYDSGTQLEFNYDGQYNTTIGTSTVGEVVILSHDKNKISVNGKLLHTFTYTSFTAPYTLILFGIHRAISAYGKVRIYSCQLYDNDTLVRDYVPVKLYDGTVGLLDKVSGCFYGNAGTGTFVAGPGRAGKYTLLEYIESTGTQYVDTGVVAKSSLVVQAKFNMTEATGYAIIGHYTSETSCLRLFNINDKCYLDFGNGSSGRIFGGVMSAGLDYDVEFGNRYVKNRSTGVDIISGSIVPDFTHTSTMCIFGNVNYSKGKIYYCKIHENGTIVRDYLPIRTEHGIVALYDSLNGVVYENAGTGDFIAGPDAITVPAVPADLSVSIEEFTAILSWSESKDATGYYVYRNGELIATTESTIFTDSIIPSISTEYSVSAFNDFGESDRTSITIAPSAAPPAPANLRVMFADFASAQIAWDASVGATVYRVYRNGEFLAETESRIFADSGLSKDTEYVYTVTAINVVGDSSTSSLTVKTSDFTLITDRTAADVEYALAQALNPDRNNTEWLKGLKGTYNATDLNRVEKAVEYVASRLEIAGWRRKPVVKIDWSFSDFPTVSEMQRYLDNIRLLRSALPVGLPAVPADMNGFTYIEANAIEQILLLLDAAVTNIMLNIYYSNEKRSGEVR